MRTGPNMPITRAVFLTDCVCREQERQAHQGRERGMKSIQRKQREILTLESDDEISALAFVWLVVGR